MVEKSESAPGGSLVRFLHQVWAHILAAITVASDIVWDFFRSCPTVTVTCRSGSGRVCVLTGARKGIGLSVLKQLLRMDYTVVCGVRNMASMEDKVKSLRDSGITSGRVLLFELDLRSLGSVKEFAEQVLSDPQVSRIDMLINHAGIYQNEYEVTEDKLEAHFQVNYLGHYLLTELLLPRIQETAAREKDSLCHIINTTSCLHSNGNLHFDNLAQRKVYVPMRCYMDSKLCNVLHAKALQRRLEAAGIGNIQAYAVHPGAISTDVWDDSLPSCLTKILHFVACPRTVDGAANVILYPAIDSAHAATCGGKYFESCRPVKPNPLADSVPLQKVLRRISRSLTQPFISPKPED